MPKGIYNYTLRLHLPAQEVLQARGQVKLEFRKNEFNGWQINSFRDMKNGLNKLSRMGLNTQANLDSDDHFPLGVGNAWLYENTFIRTSPEELRTTVTDSVVIHSYQYYRIESFLYPAFELNRLDSLKLKTFVEEDSTELTVLDFNAEIGDTLAFVLPSLPYPWIVELISEKDSVTVPAGTFMNVKEFLVTDFNSGSRFLYEFAKGVGLIRQRGTNTVNELISARVNDIVVSVETRYLNWTQIKMNFN